MNKFKRYYGIAILCALACTTLSTAAETNPKWRAIAAIKEEIELFRDAIKGTQKCITRKPCPRKQKQAMFRATKHGFAIIAIMAALGTMAYKIIPQKSAPTFDRNLDQLRRSVEKQDDRTLRILLGLTDFKPQDLKDLLVIATHFGTDVAVQKLLNITLPKLGKATFIDKKNASLLHHVAVRASQKTNNEYERQDRSKIIDLLIRRGAPINHKSGDYQATALMQAAQTHNQDLVEKLLHAGAKKALTDKEGQTAYDYATNTRAPKEILNLLKLPE